MISVVMPAYNANLTIEASVWSVIRQTYTDWELIIVDDGSTVTLPIPSDPRVRALRNDTNLGVAPSRNRGVAAALGEWIAFLDADDLWDQRKLEKQLVFSRARGARISYTGSAFIDADGQRYAYTLPARERLTYKELLRHNLMSCSSIMCERELPLRYPFPPGANIHEDFVVNLRILREVGVAYGLNEPLLTYRLSGGSKSAGRLTSALMTYNAYREVGYNALAAAALTARYAAGSVVRRGRILC
jgi:glycosyltransferase involved in cell wall biosynthesis